MAHIKAHIQYQYEEVDRVNVYAKSVHIADEEQYWHSFKNVCLTSFKCLGLKTLSSCKGYIFTIYTSSSQGRH